MSLARFDLRWALGNRPWIVVCFVTVLLVFAASTRAQTDQASPEEVKARKAFAMGAYREALELFAALYAEDPHPNYLHNIGRCYQNLGEWSRALASFQDYLRKSPDLPEEMRKRVEGYIAEIEVQLRREREAQEAQLARERETAQPEASEAAAPVPVPVQAHTEPVVPPPSHNPRTARVFAWSLTGAGAALLAVGTYFGVRSLLAYNDAEDACPSRRDCSSSALDARDDAETSAWVSNITIAGGLAASAVGLVFLWRGKRADSARVGLGIDPRGAVQLAGDF